MTVPLDAYNSQGVCNTCRTDAGGPRDTWRRMGGISSKRKLSNYQRKSR